MVRLGAATVAALIFGWSPIGGASGANALESAEARLQDGRVSVTGQTEPGATVLLDGEQVAVAGRNGRFSYSGDQLPEDCTIVLEAGGERRILRIAGCAVGGLPLGSTPLVDELDESDREAVFRAPKIVDPTLADPPDGPAIPDNLIVPRQ
jgi:hypothetical protein